MFNLPGRGEGGEIVCFTKPILALADDQSINASSRWVSFQNIPKHFHLVMSSEKIILTTFLYTCLSAVDRSKDV
jgi:hypothetical protein